MTEATLTGVARASASDDENRDLGTITAVLDVMQEGLQVLGRDWRYLYLNHAAALSHGHRSKVELLGRTMHECYPGIENTPLFAELRRCMRERVAHRMDHAVTLEDGSVEYFELRVEPIPEGLAILSIDIGDRKRLEQQLSRAHTLEAVGRLAGGLAHDFNNLLTAIMACCDLSLVGRPSDEELLANLEEIHSAAERGARLTRQLLSFSRREVVRPRTLQLNRELRELEPMLRRQLGDDVQLDLHLAPGAHYVKIDPGQLDRVIMNLVSNAKDAVGRAGRIDVRTARLDVDAALGRTLNGLKRGSYVRLTVSDDGHGMDEATLAQVFEPFFTTKSTSQGSGLGLPTSHGIVEQAGGTIALRSQPGRGTTVHVYLPLVTAGRAVTTSLPTAGLLDGHGDETVLVVDDEPQLCALSARALRAYGYTVLEAQSPAEAEALMTRHGGEIAALVSDVVMPEMNGLQLAERLRAQVPGLRALFMSGYADHSLLGQIDASHYLQKPFTPEVLACKLRAVLDAFEPAMRT